MKSVSLCTKRTQLMTFSEFGKLNVDHRCDAIWEWGFFLGKYKSEKFTNVLYSVNGYFAEMIIEPWTNKIIDVLIYKKINDLMAQSYRIEKDNPFLQVVGSAAHS